MNNRETDYLKLPLPWPTHTLDQDLPRLQRALELLDAFARVCAENEAREAETRAAADERLQKDFTTQLGGQADAFDRRLTAEAAGILEQLSTLSKTLNGTLSELAVQLRGEMTESA